MKAVKAREILFSAANEIGKLQEIVKMIKDAGVNIRAVSAWAVKDEAFFRLITSDNAKTKEVLQGSFAVEEREVVIVYMPDEVGKLESLTNKLKDNNININHIYGTTSEPGKTAMIIFSSDNNDKAQEVISE